MSLSLACAFATTLFTKMAIAADPAGNSKSIFDDDFTPSTRPGAPKSARPGATPPTGYPTPGPVAPAPGTPRLNPSGEPARMDPDAVLPGLIGEFCDAAGVVLDARVVKRVRITVNAKTDTRLSAIFRWHGFINIPTGGMAITFRFSAIGNIALKVDDRQVVANIVTLPVQLTEGRHAFSLTASEVVVHAPKETLWLGWIPNGEELQSVPSTVFFHEKKEEPTISATPPGGVTVSGTPVTGLPPAPGSVSSTPPPPGVPMPVPPAAPSPKPHGELSLPSESVVLDARKSIRARYSSEYANSSKIVRDALVKKLIDSAADPASNPAERLASLKEAATVALSCGDLKSALFCNDQIASIFKVNEPEANLALLTSASKMPRSLGMGHDIGDAALVVSRQSRDAGDYDISLHAADLAEQMYGPLSEDALPAKARKRELRDLQQQYAKIAPVMKKLNEAPNDPDANGKAGKFFCFTMGNYARGLPMLAKSADAALKALADMEATPPADTDGQFKLGDDWWDQATHETAALSTGCKERAGFWYDKGRATLGAENAPSRVINRLSTLSRKLDLLPLVDVEHPAVRVTPGFAPPPNPWKRDHDLLVYKNNMYSSTLPLPYRPAGEFDFIVEFTVVGGVGGITQYMPVKGTVLGWYLSGSIAHFSPVTYSGRGRGPVVRSRTSIIGDQRYVSVVQFRRNGVRALLNNTLVQEWITDYSDVGVNTTVLVDPHCLALHCTGQQVVISAIRVVEIGGPAR